MDVGTVRSSLEGYLLRGEPISIDEARAFSNRVLQLTDPSSEVYHMGRRIHEALILGKRSVMCNEGTLYIERESLRGGGARENIIVIGQTVASILLIAGAGPAGIAVGAGLNIFQFLTYSDGYSQGLDPIKIITECLQSAKLTEVEAKINVVKRRLLSYVDTKQMDDLNVAHEQAELAYEECKGFAKDEKYKGLESFVLLAYLNISIHFAKAEIVHPSHRKRAKEIAAEAEEWLVDCQKQIDCAKQAKRKFEAYIKSCVWLRNAPIIESGSMTPDVYPLLEGIKKFK